MKRRLTLELDDFGYEALREEAARQGVPLEELLAHAVMYYLADLDSGRIAARVLRSSETQEAPDRGQGRRRFRPSPPPEGGSGGDAGNGA